MSDIMKRLNRWRVKTSPDKVKAVLEELRDSMLANTQTVFPALLQMETETKQVLDGEGVSVLQYPFYLSFARELWRKQRQGISGSSLARETEVLIAKWEGRGLSVPVLERIRTQVFNIGPFSP
ncbi:MAG: hypothetical protein ACUVUD_06805 [bacterium]